jgi:hypothetical protein
MRPAIVHLIGFPAAGKYTVAGTLAAALGRGCVLMDNHTTGNLVLSILDLEGVNPIPDPVWDRVGEIREVVYRTIEDMSPPDWSFVFTNVLVADDPGDVAVVDRLARLAAASGRLYLPVRLHCAVDELLARVTSPERAARHKWTDAEAVRDFVTRTRLVDIGTHPALDIDTVVHPPGAAVERILAHWGSLATRERRAVE